MKIDDDMKVKETLPVGVDLNQPQYTCAQFILFNEE